MEIILPLLIGGPFIVAGFYFMFRAFKPPMDEQPGPDAAVPVAQIVVGGHSRIREPPGSKRRIVRRVVRFSVGATAVGIGVAAIELVSALVGTPAQSKGRLLRLRGRAHLPELAEGDGWSDGASPRFDSLTGDERAVLAAAWLTSARMEQASIPAFAQLSLHLVALGAPSDLIERSHRAALDELTHARRCYALASAYAGTNWTAGPIPQLGHAPREPVDFVRLAVGSLIDGCVAEGIAADTAARGARTATDPVIRDTLSMIAADEARHADLAWSVLEWALAVGGDPLHAAVIARVERLAQEITPRAPDFPGIAPDRLAAHGLFDQNALGIIAARRIDRVRARAMDLLGMRSAA